VAAMSRLLYSPECVEGKFYEVWYLLVGRPSG
jgi:hypothetical protein